MSCEAVAKVLLLDDDTIRIWYRLYEKDGLKGLTNFGYEGGTCRLSEEQQEKLTAWVGATLPRTTRQIGAWVEKEFGLVYESRSGLIKLLHRLRLEYHKPDVIPRKLDEDKQKAFIESYEKLRNSLGDDEAVLFVDAVHPTHAARPVGCWAPRMKTSPYQLILFRPIARHLTRSSGFGASCTKRHPNKDYPLRQFADATLGFHDVKWTLQFGHRQLPLNPKEFG